MAAIEVEEAVQEVETESERVLRWRREKLLRAGYDERLALKLALGRDVDLPARDGGADTPLGPVERRLTPAPTRRQSSSGSQLCGPE